MPPVAPVFAMRWVASASVVHVTLVPAEFTSGRAAHVKPFEAEAQFDKTNLPPTHCAKEVPTQAFSPSWQELSSVRLANLAFKA